MFYIYTVTFNTVCSADAGSSHSVGLQLPLRKAILKVSRFKNAVVTLTGCQAKGCSVQISAYMYISSGMLLRSGTSNEALKIQHQSCSAKLQ